MPLLDKFVSENPYVLTAKMQTAENNQAALLTALDETNGLRATAVIFQAQGLAGQLTAPIPLSVQAASQDVIGAALSGGGDGGEVLPCFVGDTLIWMADGTSKMIQDIEVGKDIVKCFDLQGNLFVSKVTDKWIHEVDGYLRVCFDDGRVTDVTPNHRYWMKHHFQPISEIESVFHYNSEWQVCKTTKKETVRKPTIVCNITVEKYHTYFANGDAVSNVKAL